MKIKITASIALISAIISAGCASLSSKIHNNIHEGDSKKHVEDILGEPEEFQKSEKNAAITIWGYHKKADVCAIVFKKEVVVKTECKKDPNYRNFLQAFGQGFAQSQHDNQPTQQTKPTHCTSDFNGGYNCQ